MNHCPLFIFVPLFLLMVHCDQKSTPRSVSDAFLTIPSRFISVDETLRPQLLAEGEVTDTYQNKLSLTSIGIDLLLMEVSGGEDDAKYEISYWETASEPVVIIQELGYDPEKGSYVRKMNAFKVGVEWVQLEQSQLGLPAKLDDYIIDQDQLKGFITDGDAYYWKEGKFEFNATASSEPEATPGTSYDLFNSSLIPGTKITKTEFSGVYLDEDAAVARQKIHDLTGGFETGRQLNLKSLLYPEPIAGLLEEDELTSFGAIEPIEAREIGDFRIFRYKISIEAEGLRGFTETLRICRDGKWLTEYSYFTGAGVGATLTRHEAKCEWLTDGFVISLEDTGVYPLMACMEGVNLDAMCENHRAHDVRFSASNDFSEPISIRSSEGKNVIVDKRLSSAINSAKDLEEYLKQRITEPSDLSANELAMLRTGLYKVKMDHSDIPVVFHEPVDDDRVLADLKATGRDISIKLAYELGDVRVYALSERHLSSLLFFNTLNEYLSGGDYHLELFADLRKIGLKHFSLVSGTVKGSQDLNGDGVYELIVSQVSNYRTTFSGGSDVYFVDEYRVLNPAGLYAPSAFEGGICDKLQGYSSTISFTEEGIKILDEQGGSDCANQNYILTERYYQWDIQKKDFIPAEPPTTVMEYLSWVENNPAIFSYGESWPTPGPVRFSNYWVSKDYAPLAAVKGNNSHMVVLRAIGDYGEPTYRYLAAFYSDKGLIGQKTVISGENLYCPLPVVEIVTKGGKNYISVSYEACEESHSKASQTFFEIRDRDLEQMEGTP